MEVQPLVRRGRPKARARYLAIATTAALFCGVIFASRSRAAVSSAVSSALELAAPSPAPAAGRDAPRPMGTPTAQQQQQQQQRGSSVVSAVPSQQPSANLTEGDAEYSPCQTSTNCISTEKCVDGLCVPDAVGDDDAATTPHPIPRPTAMATPHPVPRPSISRQ